MTVADILLIAALAAFVVVWWLRRAPARPLFLLVLAAVALAAGLWGVADDRWQAGLGAAVAAILLVTLLVNRLRKADRRDGVPFVSGTAFALLAVLAAAALVAFPVSPLPRPSGPHPVGVRTFAVTDAGRPGLFHAGPGEPRRLLVRVWYPAGDVAGRTPRPYFTKAEAGTTARSIGALVGFPPFFAHLKHVRTHSYEDAPLAPGAQRLPVVFYSHGYTSFLAQNTVLMEHLASHGYIVFSPQHTFDSAATVFPEGAMAPVDPAMVKEMATPDGKPAKDEVLALTGRTLDDRLAGQLRLRETGLARNARLTRSGVVWAADRVFLHDVLQQGRVPPAIREIAAAGDLSRTGEMGMSFGGATAGTVCMVDRRCAAGINLDGGDFPFQAFDADMPVPFMMFHSDLRGLAAQLGVKTPGPPHSFNEFSYEAFANAGTRADVHRMQLLGARHLGLSDFSLFLRRPLRDPLFGRAPARVMIGAQNDMVLGFFDRYLRGLPNGFPERQARPYAGWLEPVPNGDVRQWWAAKSEAERAAIEARVARARAGKAGQAPPRAEARPAA